MLSRRALVVHLPAAALAASWAGRVLAADKTITVEIPVVRRHPAYEKIVRRSSKLHAHDESNQAQEGDVVRVIESRPLSRTKRWRLLEVVERSR